MRRSNQWHRCHSKGVRIEPRHNHCGPVAIWRERGNFNKANPRTTSQTKRCSFLPTLRLTRWSINFCRAGIKGLVLKTDPSADLIEATKALWQDRLYFSRSVTTAIVGNYLCADFPSVEYTPTFHRLTLREQEVAQLLAEGKASKEVGDILGISYRTANTHRSNLMRKLSIHNCAALTFYAATHLIIKDPRFTVLANIVEFPRSAPQIGPRWREERRSRISALATTSDSSVVSRASMRV